MGLPPTDFESVASAIPPLGLSDGNIAVSVKGCDYYLVKVMALVRKQEQLRLDAAGARA